MTKTHAELVQCWKVYCECGKHQTVYHLNWSAILCKDATCGEILHNPVVVE